MTETYAGMLARTLPEFDRRVLAALASENHYREQPNQYWAENRRGAIAAIVQRAEDAGVPEWIR